MAWNKAFWLDTTNRTVATSIETALPLLVAVEKLPELDYEHAGWIVLGAALLTVLNAVRKEARKHFVPDPEY